MNSSAATDLDTLRSQIEHHRADLGETVEALTAKFDVKALGKYFTNAIAEDTILRAQDAIGHGRERLRSAGDQAMRLPGRIFSGTSAGPGAPGDAVAGAVAGVGIATLVYALTRRYVSSSRRRRSRTSWWSSRSA